MSTPWLGEVRAPLPALPGQPRRDDPAEQRQGTATMVSAFAPGLGQRETHGTAPRTPGAGASCRRARVAPPDAHGENMRRVLDHLPTHTHASRAEALEPPEAQSIADPCAIHETPKHGRGFTMAERERSHLRRQGLGGRLATQAPRRNTVRAWNTKRHEQHAKAPGPFPTDDARGKLRRLYPIVSI